MAIIGRLAPPFGGVTIHITRLARMLLESGIPYRVYDTDGRPDPVRHAVAGGNSPKWFLKFLTTVPEMCVHLHTNNIKTIMLAAAILPLFGRRLLISLHSEAPMRWYESVGSLKQACWREAIKRCQHVIVANQTLYSWLGELGLASEQRSLIPPFLPPSQAEITDGDLPSDVLEFLESHSPIIGSQGFFGYFVDGEHLYSFDMIHDLLVELKRQYPRLGVYTFISDTYDDNHKEKTLSERAQSGLDDSWVFLSGVPNSTALYNRTDLYLRPTITDGDSMSLRECLFLGVPVIASDAVPRPEGSVLFRNRDQGDLTAKALEVLTNLELHREQLQRLDSDQSINNLRAIYNDALKLPQAQPDSIARKAGG
ncbi:MAG: glycosyltransferase family 4 protein [bacterium]|nr:glycosyltransferase family 4 protein [bacterium]